MEVMIGVDPHKGSHTATMLDHGERELRRIKVRAGAPSGRASCSRGRTVSSRGRGRWSRPAGWATCSPSSLSPPARRCSMCRRRWRRGCGCWARASRPRPTRTMPARSLSPRCGPRRWRRCDRLITSRCAGCWSSVTAIWPAGGTSCAAGCTPSSPSWCPAGSARKWSSTRHDQPARRDRARRRGGGRTAPPSGRARRRDRPARRRPARLESAYHRRGDGVGHDADGDLRGRPDRRRHAHRLQRRPDPVRPPPAATPPTPAPPRSSSPPADASPTGCPGAATAGSTTPCTSPRSPRSATRTAPDATTTTASSPKATPHARRSAR